MKAAPHPNKGPLNLIRTPINLSDCPQPETFHHAAPDPGQHTDEILAEMGVDASRIASLRKSGAIA